MRGRLTKLETIDEDREFIDGPYDTQSNLSYYIFGGCADELHAWWTESVFPCFALGGEDGLCAWRV